ncbi:MAG: hypothetical protein VX498_13815 [Myxococcota bacterium]|nr:hypothetical protein [Myxococcota bacterium]
MPTTAASPEIDTGAPEIGETGPAQRGRGFLRFLSRWDHDQGEVLRAIGELAGRAVEFSGTPPPNKAADLFSLFERSPLDAVSQQDDGTWVIPYNPWLAYRQIVEERYLRPPSRPLHTRLPFNYHRVPG